MNRTTGEYVSVQRVDTHYRAFVPYPLPPQPAIVFEGELLAQLERANQALGRLAGSTQMLPNHSLLLYQYVRREALLSSQIEGTQSSLSDLMLYELDEAPGVPVDDVEEVSNYVAALDHSVKKLAQGAPLSLGLICEMHGILLRGGRGANKTPGEFRRNQNWVGGRTPATASFVPPPPERLDECLNAFEQFLQVPGAHLPPLIKAALAHVQFETIHPFRDGNGRVGRLLLVLMLCRDGTLGEPSLYLSLWFKTHRREYYQLLDQVRRQGDWEAWLSFFLEGVEQTALQETQTTRRILQLFESDRARLQTLGRIRGSAEKVYEQFTRRPILSAPQIQRALQTVQPMTPPTVRSALKALSELGLLNEITGQRRNRLWMYQAYYNLLSEGAEPI